MRKMGLSWAIVVLALTLPVLVSCEKSQVGDKTLDSKLVALELKVSELEKTIADIKALRDFDSLLATGEKVAYMTPGSNGYGVLKMDLGSLTVALANIAPYANGSKITLRFGNLTSATIDGLKAKVEWGSVDSIGNAMNETAKSRNVELTESMLSGAWNTAEIVVEGVPPSALGFVRVRDVSHRAIRLRVNK